MRTQREQEREREGERENHSFCDFPVWRRVYDGRCGICCVVYDTMGKALSKRMFHWTEMIANSFHVLDIVLSVVVKKKTLYGKITIYDR